MPIHSEQQILPYKTSEVFAIVKDVEKYPEFLPWCKAARISEISETGFLGELLISYKNISESYISKISFKQPQHEHEYCEIEVDLVQGPFKHLSNRWRFEPIGDATKVSFELDFAFKIKLLEKIMGSFFQRVNEKMVEAFKARAAEIYSKN